MDSDTCNYILTLFDNHLEILNSIIESYFTEIKLLFENIYIKLFNKFFCSSRVNNLLVLPLA